MQRHRLLFAFAIWTNTQKTTAKILFSGFLCLALRGLVLLSCRLHHIQLLCHTIECSPSGPSGVFQARILEWVAISFSRGSSRPKDWTRVSCVSYIGRQILYLRASREVLCIRAHFYIPFLHTSFTYLFQCSLFYIYIHNIGFPISHINTFIYNTLCSPLAGRVHQFGAHKFDLRVTNWSSELTNLTLTS